ncbi:MAG: (2Fe-2S)-binding protein [Burkholderiales bacterium]|nr:(2Fe-2S)-binding protein [Burkholderiales bacterium]
MFKLLPESNPLAPAVTVVVNGRSVAVPQGCSAAAAMLMHGGGSTRTTPVSGEARAPYCMMGLCYECLMEIDGEPNQQGCLVIVREGMHINPQLGKPGVKP